MSIKHLPTPENQHISIGYLRLTDAAPFLVARELDFFQGAGLEVKLEQQVSWANLRDSLVAGHCDAAQFLAPLPAMTTFGASGLRKDILTGLVLSRNGNAITLHRNTLTRLQEGKPFKDEPLTLATVHAFSTHTLLLRRWLKTQGLDPVTDVRWLIIPPSQMVDSLQQGVVDGFCAGEPWNSLAVEKADAQIAAIGSDIWPNAPEKVLAVTREWHEANPNTHLCMRVALMRACQWLADEGNQKDALEMLSRPDNLDLPTHLLTAKTLQLASGHSGHMADLNSNGNGQGRSAQVTNMHVFWGDNLNNPDFETARIVTSESLAILDRIPAANQLDNLVNQSYRADLYTQALPYCETP